MFTSGALIWPWARTIRSFLVDTLKAVYLLDNKPYF
jgi:hypothetical protein